DHFSFLGGNPYIVTAAKKVIASSAKTISFIW
ncbi:hypothetical protein CCACVL1_01072, partial [Corchorus capsularis]